MGKLPYTGDLAYLLGHRLTRDILKRRAELVEEAQQLPEESPERRGVEKFVSQLEEYILPKPTAHELQQTSLLTNQHGETVGIRQSLRRRYRDTRRGRPEEYRVQTLAALEEKLANPTLTWSALALRYGFADVTRRAADGSRVRVHGHVVLERAVCRLRQFLREAGVALPHAEA